MNRYIPTTILLAALAACSAAPPRVASSLSLDVVEFAEACPPAYQDMLAVDNTSDSFRVCVGNEGQ